MKNPAGESRQLLEILDALKNIELTLSRIYLACSKMFPEDGKLWSELHQEEQKHAAMIEQLKELAQAYPEKCSLGRFNLQTISTFQKGIENQINDFNSGKIDRVKALNLSRDYENSILEKNFIDSIMSPLPEFQSMKRKISQDTYQHRKRIIDHLQSLKIKP